MMMPEQPTMTIDKNGTKVWYLNGKCHRENGPAYESANGDKYWYLNGKLHREDGPAIEYADGEKEWLLNDKELTEDQFLDWKFIQWCTTPVEYAGVE